MTCRTPYYSAIHGILWRIHLNDIIFVLYVLAVQQNSRLFRNCKCTVLEGQVEVNKISLGRNLNLCTGEPDEEVTVSELNTVALKQLYIHNLFMIHQHNARRSLNSIEKAVLRSLVDC